MTPGARFRPSRMHFSLALVLALALVGESRAQLITSDSPVASQDNQVSNQPIKDWFTRYDQIRRQAQMTPQERSRADQLLSKGLSMMIPGQEKISAQKLLNKLVAKNNQAAEQLKQTRLLKPTEQLHRGYFRYFLDARNLFRDYLTVQDNPLAVDQSSGKLLAGGLMARKQNLEALDTVNKQLDEQLRAQYGIPPYQY